LALWKSQFVLQPQAEAAAASTISAVAEPASGLLAGIVLSVISATRRTHCGNRAKHGASAGK